MENKLLIVSSIFGKKFKKVHPAPLSNNCYFFSNNQEIKDEVEEKGWSFVHVDKELSSNYLVSSLQSKYIKFLRFLRDYNQFKKYNQILYFDHKLAMNEENVHKILDIYDESGKKYNIIIRSHEQNRFGIFTEIDDSLMFDKISNENRYSKNMEKTIDFVNKNIPDKNAADAIQICNTGMMLYSNYDEIMPLLDEVYDTCVSLEQPQCQIVWSVLSQKYKDKIKVIDFRNVINPRWSEPFAVIEPPSSNYYLYLLFFVIFFVGLLYFYSSIKRFVFNIIKKLDVNRHRI
jgi:hypothetical protein